MQIKHPMYIGRHTVLAPTCFGAVLAVPSYNIDVAVGIIRDGVIEAWNNVLVKRFLKPGGKFVNVGANLGYFTALAGHVVGHRGRVYAFEANPHLMPYLMATLNYAGIIDRTELFNRAVYHKDGVEMEFEFNPHYIGGGHLNVEKVNTTPRYKETLEECLWDVSEVPGLLDEKGRWYAPCSKMKKFNVKTVTLDKSLPADAQVDMMLIDVEGAENFVLHGAFDIIARSPNLKILVEWSNHYIKHFKIEDMAQKTWEFLTGHGFAAYKVVPGGVPDTLADMPIMVEMKDFETLRAQDLCDVLFTRERI